MPINPTVEADILKTLENDHGYTVDSPGDGVIIAGTATISAAGANANGIYGASYQNSVVLRTGAEVYSNLSVGIMLSYNPTNRIASNEVLVESEARVEGKLTGVSLQGSVNTLNNSGKITGGYGVQLGTAFSLCSGNRIVQSESGSIIATTDNGIEIIGDATIVNSGLIQGAKMGIHALQPSYSITINNYGTIVGQSGAAIDSQTATTTITNYGLIKGGIHLGTGNDLYEGKAGAVTGTVSLGAGNDRAYGGAGAEIFDGGANNDTLDGGGGNDTLIQKAGDGNDRLVGGDGIDTVIFADTEGAIINLALTSAQTTAYGSDTFIGIENLSGGEGNDRFTGNTLANTLKGNAGNDTLDGGYGNDVLIGGTGNDTFVFKDRLSKTGNVDRITDYDRAFDSIQLDNKYMEMLGPVGRLSSSKFVLGTKAKDANDHLIYDQGTGKLYYDADGSGASAQVLIAQFTNKAVLTSAEFTII